MTREDLEALDDRQLDHLVAEHIFGLVPKTIKPDWYPVEVTLFLDPFAPFWIEYSYDARSCNACMHRNGVDEKGGTARPLPYWAEEDETATEVTHQMVGAGFAYEIRRLLEPTDPEKPYTARFYSTTADRSADGYCEARAVCIAALLAREQSGPAADQAQKKES